MSPFKAFWGRSLKWIAATTAVLSLVFSVHQGQRLFHEWRARRAAVSELVKASQLQRKAGEYSSAWRLVGEALEKNPDSHPARDEQLLVAMQWLRDIRVNNAQGQNSFSELVDKLVPVLSRAAATASGTDKADLLAHLGWATFLKWRDGIRGPAVTEQYRNALEIDRENAYANAMLAHWMLYSGNGGGNRAEAATRFATALKGARSAEERGFVRRLQVSAWLNRHEEFPLELVRVADEMRTNGEALDLGQRERILSYAYSTADSREEFERFTSVLQPADHLATFLWLTEGMDIKENAGYRLSIARLTEAAGDRREALALYRSLLIHFNDRLPPRTKNEVHQALARLSLAPK